MLGFGWYSNYRIYEKDKANLQSELDRLMLSRWTELSQKVERAAATEAALLRKSIEEQSTRISRGSDEQKQASEAIAKKAIEPLEAELQTLRFNFLEFLSDTAGSGADYGAYRAHLNLLHASLKTESDSKISKALERIIKLLQARQEFYYDDIAHLGQLAGELSLTFSPYKEQLRAELSRLKPTRI
jgi:hypothetical protein